METLLLPAQEPFDKLLEVMQLKIVMPAEGLPAVQIVCEESMARPEALVQGIGEGAVPAVLEPVVAVQVGVCLHIADKTALIVLPGEIFSIRRGVAIVFGKPLQLRGIAHDEGTHKIDGIQRNIGINIDIVIE